MASLRLKNERGETLSSQRSDHVTGVWGELTNLYNVQRLFHHLGCAFFVSATIFCPVRHCHFTCVVSMHLFNVKTHSWVGVADPVVLSSV